ncbi:MAG: glutamate synthase-related protein [Solirubrobacterales bacterium]
MTKNGFPENQGLYNSELEKDNCGVGFVVQMKGIKSNSIIKDGLQILKNLKHRGAVGADPDSGDGSGILIQIPHSFFKKEMELSGSSIPEIGEYAVGMLFLPREPNIRLFCEGIFEKILKEENLRLIGWRQVPVNEKACGESARATRPVITQVFIQKNGQSAKEFNQQLFIVRKRAQNVIWNSQKPNTNNFYIPSLSDKTIIYKGLVSGSRLEDFYLDLQDESLETAIALVHERYSTNTFPSWQLAQPFRYIAHNGEINTIIGNINKMNAREGVMYSKSLGENFNKTLPVIEPNGSDSASLDNAFELLFQNGFSMEYSMMMLIPEAWEKNILMDDAKKAFYEYHARLMEPWDGPSTIAFTDGIKIGVGLDRNGLRPARYTITKNDLVIMASETGVIDIDKTMVIKKGFVEPGKLFLIDTTLGKIIPDDEIKDKICKSYNFKEWINKNKLSMGDIKQHCEIKTIRSETLKVKQRIFGYTEDDLKNVISCMVNTGKEPMGSMGMDIPLAVLSEKPELLFNYFKQTFAQVTNPPIDPIREASVMSLTQYIGTHGKVIDEIEIDKDRKFIKLTQPVLSNSEIEDIKHLESDDFRPITIPMIFETDKENGLKEALDTLCKRAEESVISGNTILILSDKNINLYYAPIPSLLALSAVHNHLIRKKLRTSTDIIVEAGDARDVMHIALLTGFGAKAVNPYMVYYLISYMIENKKYITNILSVEEGFNKYKKAVSGGLLKIISRMGISTLQSYNGAQTFQIIGLNDDVVRNYFPNTPSRISGISLDKISEDVLNLQNWQEKNQNKKQNLINIRDLLDFKNTEPLPVNDTFNKNHCLTVPNSIEVESIESIMKRFTISGMSFGSISKEAHETIAVAMNRIGASSNSGEGGEDPERYKKDENGDDKNSAVKQIASARFGVTASYLVNCKEIQIKMAQGAKPGEGGHLPGRKVTAEIAKVRRSVPGIDLISPPPHHDIYSIEDLAQLIFDLKNVNPKARIGVKLVSEVGIGTVAAGVAKGHADVIMISGHDGGTGSAPISSMKYVGLPWELGLAEVQQTLLLNDLRSRVILQVDGKIKNGRDIVIASLLGAEEFGFATEALVSLGCVLCKQCSQNKCPAGIATQDPELRKRFKGTPWALLKHLSSIAEEVRYLMIRLGFSNMDEMTGRSDILGVKAQSIEKLKDLDLTQLLFKPELPERIIGRHMVNQQHKIEDVLDIKLIELSEPSIKKGLKTNVSLNIRNINRSTGTMLSGEIARNFGDESLADDTITFNFKGSAGQSFGGFCTKGLTLILEGDANDYVGKGLSGGKLILTPPKTSTFNASENVIAGNTILYGAVSGKAFISGKVGQRFCVRNSGAEAVVEGIGNHGCEYMTGGTVVILGKVGTNFGAGMSGGTAFILDDNNEIISKCNKNIVKYITPLDDNNIKDSSKLLNLLEEHYESTNSFKAKQIIDNWNFYKHKFVKISALSYQKQLK